MNTSTQELRKKWEALKEGNPHLRIRNAAQQLGVSEAELVLTKVGEGTTVLNNDFKGLLLDIEKLGKVMALTRNEECVHERKGVYLNPDFTSPHAQLFVGEDIDLRIFMSSWKYAFSVIEGDRKSFQFFGKDGLALHKIYLTKDSNEEMFDVLTEKYKAEEQFTTIVTEALPPKPAEKPDSEIEVDGFQKAWVELKDTHDFFIMLKKFGLSRTQALRLAPEGYAKKVDNDVAVKLLQKASEKQVPIMVFVGNRGIIQIHTGTVNKVLWHGPWYNVMDPDFNLHLDTTKIAETWIVKKESEDGLIHSVEIFNKDGEMIIQFFGKRKPGIPELQEWRDLVAEL